MIKVIYADLPPKVKGFTVLKEGYYTIVLNQNLTREQNKVTYLHEMGHIENRDFEKTNIQDIESLAHKKGDRYGII